MSLKALGLGVALLATPLIAHAATPFTGGDLSLWLEADQGLAANGSTWDDQSGMGNNATALQGQAPTVTPGVYGGLPAVQFNGGQAMSFANPIITSQQFTIIALVTDPTNNNSANTGFREVLSNWDSSTQTSSIFLGDTGVDPTAVRFTDAVGGALDINHNQTGVGAAPNPAQPFVLAGVSSSTDALVYPGSGAVYDAGSPLPTRDLSESWYLGRQGSSPFEYWTGDIEEVMVYNSALTPDEIAQDQAYLLGKYQLSAVPEPASWALALVGFGALGLALRARRRSLVAVA